MRFFENVLANLRITKIPWHNLTFCLLVSYVSNFHGDVRRVGGGFRRVRIEPPLQVNDGGLKAQGVNFQLVANSGGMENKL